MHVVSKMESKRDDELTPVQLSLDVFFLVVDRFLDEMDKTPLAVDRSNVFRDGVDGRQCMPRYLTFLERSQLAAS